MIFVMVLPVGIYRICAWFAAIAGSLPTGKHFVASCPVTINKFDESPSCTTASYGLAVITHQSDGAHVVHRVPD